MFEEKLSYEKSEDFAGKKANFKKNHIIPCGVDLEVFSTIDKNVAREKMNLKM